LARQLTQLGASVDLISRVEDGVASGDTAAILVALRPHRYPVVGSGDARMIARLHPSAVVTQFWGDIDRGALASVGLRFWPLDAPPPGHQGILPGSIGPEPVIRLQAGGLKVGEVMAQARRKHPEAAGYDRATAAAVESGFGTAILEGEPALERPQFGADGTP